MTRVSDIYNLKQLYEYQMKLHAPYFYPVDFKCWAESFINDMDGEGRLLFCKLYGKVAYDGNTLIGYIQFGYTAFGFDDQGEISPDVSYPIIRSLYFDEERQEAGQRLLDEALKEFGETQIIYAFFHYFGMSCFARHGKLFENFNWIQEMLSRNEFEIEHENVYYSKLLENPDDIEVKVAAHSITTGGQQSFDFLLNEVQVGGGEAHYLNAKGIAYLRWIYVNDSIQNQGIGSRCMEALKQWLCRKGIMRLDTDTALTNMVAQHYYEKNGFIREGITRSYFRIRQS